MAREIRSSELGYRYGYDIVDTDTGEILEHHYNYDPMVDVYDIIDELKRELEECRERIEELENRRDYVSREKDDYSDVIDYDLEDFGVEEFDVCYDDGWNTKEDFKDNYIW